MFIIFRILSTQFTHSIGFHHRGAVTTGVHSGLFPGQIGSHLPRFSLTQLKVTAAYPHYYVLWARNWQTESLIKVYNFQVSYWRVSTGNSGIYPMELLMYFETRFSSSEGNINRNDRNARWKHMAWDWIKANILAIYTITKTPRLYTHLLAFSRLP